MKSIRSKLISSFIFIAIIPTTIVAFYGLYHSIQFADNLSINNVKEDVEKKVSQIKAFLSGTISDLLLLSEIPSVVDLGEDLISGKSVQKEALDDTARYFLKFAENKKVYHQVRFLDLHGMEIVRINYENNKASIVKALELQDKFDRYYFKEALLLKKKGDVYVSFLDLNREGTPPQLTIPYTPVMRYVTPVFTRKDERAGFIVLNLLAEEFLDFVSTRTPKKEGRIAFLVDQYGYYLRHTMISKEWGHRINLDTGENLFRDYPEEVVKRFLSKKEGHLIHQDKLYYYKPIFPYGEDSPNCWVIVEGRPKEEVFLLTDRLRVGFAGIVVFAFIGAIVLGRWRAKNITRPIEQLRESAEFLSNGVFDKMTTIETNDEIGELSRVFNRMAENLREAFNNLKSENEKVEMVIRNMQDGLLIFDKDDRLFRYNDAGVKYFRLKEGDIGKKKEEILKGFQIEKRGNEVLEIWREEPKELYLEVRESNILNEKGEREISMWVIRDITDEKLEDKLKQEFLSLMSHKLRTPIAVITGNLSIVMEGLVDDKPEKKKELIEKSFLQAKNLTTLIDRVLRFVVKVTTKGSLEKIILLEFIKERVEKVRRDFPEKEIDAYFYIEEDVREIMYNREDLTIIVDNILENAVKFNDKEVVKIEIAVVKKDKEIEVSIKDNGIGIPSEEYDNVFEAFYQVERDFTGNIGGVGLGLTLVKRLAEKYGGRVGIESELGKYTRVWFTIRVVAIEK